MSEKVSGLLTQKQDSPYGVPAVGDTRSFDTEQRPKKDGSGTWTKLKNSKDGYGQEFKVLKADQLDNYNHPQHGTFEQFSLLLERVDTTSSNGASSTKDDDIKWGLALKLANFRIADSHVEEAEYPARLRALATALLPIVEGGADPKVSGPWHADENPDDPAATESVDADIPF